MTAAASTLFLSVALAACGSPAADGTSNAPSEAPTGSAASEGGGVSTDQLVVDDTNTCWLRVAKEFGPNDIAENNDIDDSYICFDASGSFEWSWIGEQDAAVIKGTWAADADGYVFTPVTGAVADPVPANIRDGRLFVTLGNGYPLDVFYRYGPCQDIEACLADYYK